MRKKGGKLMKKGKINAIFKLVLAAFMVFSCLPSSGVVNIAKAAESNLALKKKCDSQSFL